MSLTSTPQAKLLFEKMRHTQARQEVASDNIARAGVAGARSKKIEDFKEAVKNTVMKTHAGHMTPGSVNNDTGFHIKKSKAKNETSISGNNINPEKQLLALNEAATDFFRLEQINKNEKSRIRLIAGLGNGK